MAEQTTPTPATLPASLLQQIEREIEAGLPNEQECLRHAMMALDYYRLDGKKHIPLRDAENDFDFRLRPKRSLPITRRVVEVLTSHLYSPGPSRHLDGEPEATDWLAGVYADNLMNSLWQRADRLATLNGWDAFQVSSTGDARRPIRVQLWGREQLTAFCHPDDACTPVAVVTIDRYDEQTRYTLWTAESYKVYLTTKLAPNEPPVGRTARYRPDLSGPNPYGVLPFSFVYFELPTDTFDVQGVGNCLRHANAQVDIAASDLAEAIQKYHRPRGVAYDADVDFQPIDQPGKFIRVTTRATDLEKSNPPRLEYLQATLDIAGGWEDIRQYLNSVLEGLGVPLSAVRMEQQAVSSGIAIIAEQAPLLGRAKERQEPFRRYETDLAKLVLHIGATMGGRPELAKLAADPKLLLAWPEPNIPIPGPDRDASDQAEMQIGITSAVMIAQRRLGLSREQAIEHIRRVAEDNAVVAGLFPDGTPKEGNPGTPDDQPQDVPPDRKAEDDDAGDAEDSERDPAYDDDDDENDD